jgi:hypothetical protein
VLLLEKFRSEILFWVPVSFFFGCHLAERQGFVLVFGFGAKAPPRSFFISGSVPRSVQRASAIFSFDLVFQHQDPFLGR